MVDISPHHIPCQFGKLLVYVMPFDNRDCVCSATQFCSTFWDSMDCNLPGSSVHGIFQARIQERVAMPSSRGPSPPKDQTRVSWVSCTDWRILYHGPPGKATPHTLMIGAPSCLPYVVKRQGRVHSQFGDAMNN